MKRLTPGQLHIETGKIAFGGFAINHTISPQLQENLRKRFGLGFIVGKNKGGDNWQSPPGAFRRQELEVGISWLKRLKTVKDNAAEPMVVKNWETVDVARLVKIENAFQDSIVVDGWG